MSSYISLKTELEDLFEKPLDELPEDLQKRVERGFRPTPWDNLTPDDRRRRARLWDGWENPAFEKEQRRLWELAGIERIAKIEDKIKIWESAGDNEARDLEVKQKKLKKLKKKLRKAEEECDRVLGSGTRTGESPVTPKTNRDKKLQAREGRRKFTKVNTRVQKDNNSLPKMGGVARAAQYARLEQQAIKLYREGQFDSKRQASEDLYQPIKMHAYNEKFKIPAPKASTIYRWLLKLN